jgi:Leucine-rich repeat (LRR) protein
MLSKLENTLMHKFRAVKQFMMVSAIGASLTFPLMAMEVDEPQATSSNAKRTLSLAQLPNDIMPLILSPLAGDDLCALWATGKTMHYHLKTKAQVFEVYRKIDIPNNNKKRIDCNIPMIFIENLSVYFPNLITIEINPPRLTGFKPFEVAINNAILENIVSLTKLEMLDITHCKLPRLPNTFSQLSTLTSLKMCGNAIYGMDLLTQLESLECTLDDRDDTTGLLMPFDAQILTRLPRLTDLSLTLASGNEIMIPRTLHNFNLMNTTERAQLTFETGGYELKTLTIDNLSDIVIENIINSKRIFPHLTSLNMGNVGNCEMVHSIRPIGKFAPALTELSINVRCDAASEYVRVMFKEFPCFEQLKKLSLIGSWINHSSVNNLAHFTNITCSLPNLTDLSLARGMLPYSVSTEQIFQTLKNLPRLENLTLYDFSSITCSDMMMLPNVKSLKFLRDEFSDKFDLDQKSSLKVFGFLPSSLTSFQIDSDYLADPEAVFGVCLSLFHVQV